MLYKTLKIMLLLLITTQATYGQESYPIKLELVGISEVANYDIDLTNEQWLWLAKKNKITVAVYPRDTPPLELNMDAGYYRGINADYLKIMERALKTNIEVVLYPNRKLAYAALEKHQVDLILSPQVDFHRIVNTYKNSDPVVKSYPILVTSQDNSMKPVHTDEQVKIAISNNYPSNSFVKTSFPNAEIITFPNEYSALESVANGYNDYYIGNNLTSHTIMERDFIHMLNVAKLWRSPEIANRFIALPSEPKLIDIVNKFLSGLTPQIQNQITQFWVNDVNPLILFNEIALTQKEKRWIDKNKKLRVIINQYYVPFTMLDSNSEIRGLIGDVLDIISLKTGLTFEPIVVKSNSEMADIMHNDDWDIVPTLSYSAEREELVSFTQPFITTSFVVVTRNDTRASKKFMSGMRVGIPTYHILFNKLKEKYPNIEWVTVDNSSVALSMVCKGTLDASISNMISARYMIEHYYPEKLTYFKIEDEKPLMIGFGIPRGERELQQIIEKSFNDISQSEILSLTAKWAKRPNIKIDTWNLYNNQFYLVIFLAILLVFSSLLWALYLANEIKKRKKSQSDLETQLSFRHTLSNSIPMPVYVISQDGILKSYNSALISFFSKELQQEIRPSLFDRRHPMSKIFTSIYDDIKNGLAPGCVSTHNLTLNNGSEERSILHWCSYCIMPDKIPPTIICGWQDITESKKLLQALKVEKDKAIKANEAKRTFLASMSHEIRTPISTIMGFLELLSTHNLSPDEEKESLQLAYSTAQHLLGLLGDILDMEKIESGHFELSPDWVDVDSLLTTTVKSFEGLAKQKKLSISIRNTVSKGILIWLDPKAFRQVLSNLLSNAIKFTQKGSVSVSAEIKMTNKNGNLFILSVTDTGSGISKQDQEKLFKPFSQTYIGKQVTGSGLGLMICRELVLRMKGKIKLFSQLDEGTTLVVSLPVLLNDKQNEEVAFSRSEALVPTSLSILIADDHPNNRLLLRRQLEQFGYLIDDAIDGQQALSLIQDGDYDLLITDINMPIMDGITLAKKIRYFNSEIVIWGLTANAQAEEKERCINAGMNLCLFKPISLQQLETSLSLIKRKDRVSRLGDIINLPQMKTLTMGDNDVTKRILLTSKVENIKDLKLAQKAINTKDWITFRSHVHRIHGTAQILGVSVLMSLCEEVETIESNDNNADFFKEKIAEIAEVIQELNIEIDIIVKEK